MTDWFDTTLRKELVVEKVSLSNIDEVEGILTGIDRSSSSLECGYYTDTRESGRIAVIGDSYERGYFVRPVLEIPNEGYRRELGLYLVWNDPASKVASSWKYELELHSMLFALSKNISGTPWAIATNAKALTAMRQMLAKCGVQYVMPDAIDYAFKSAKVLESGTSWLTRLYALCEQSNNRLDVDGHGRVTVSRYVAPTDKTPAITLDIMDPRGLIKSIRRSGNHLSMPTQVVVHCKYSETQNNKTIDKEIVGQADASGKLSSGTRGFVVTSYVDLSDMSPRTTARANQLAREYLQRSTTELVEWTISTPYIPVWEGDVVMLRVHGSGDEYVGDRACLVKSINMDLLHFDMTLTLKEVSSGDWGEE